MKDYVKLKLYAQQLREKVKLANNNSNNTLV